MFVIIILKKVIVDFQNIIIVLKMLIKNIANLNQNPELELDYLKKKFTKSIMLLHN